MSDKNNVRMFGMLIICIIFMPFLTGCFTAAKLGLSEVTGGKKLLVVIKQPLKSKIYQYKYIKIERFKNKMGNILPPETIPVLYAACVDEILKEPMQFKIARNGAPANKTLIIRGSIIHYNPAGGLSAVMGKFAQIICRVELIDKSTGQVLGVAHCIGFSKAIMRAGIEELSEGVAKAIRDWLMHLKPPPDVD